MRKHNSESLGSLLARAPRRSKSGLSAWSRESRFGVRRYLSKRMSTKKKNDRAFLECRRGWCPADQSCWPHTVQKSQQFALALCGQAEPRSSDAAQRVAQQCRRVARRSTSLTPGFQDRGLVLSYRAARTRPRCFVAHQVRSHSAAGSSDLYRQPGPQHAYPSGRRESRLSFQYSTRLRLRSMLHEG